jgi:hypothetical protein
VRITGVAAEVPPTVVSTAEVEERPAICERFHFEPGWLERATQVRERRWAAPDVKPSDLAVLSVTLREKGVHGAYVRESLSTRLQSHGPTDGGSLVCLASSPS